uniref:C-type lectin domain-containing protein n=1 Tax=Maylandia zebra TaxID=106582 RepID=A0A3P9CYJ6_9CICH
LGKFSFNLFCVVILPFLFPLSPTELRCSGPDWFEFGDFCYKPFGDKKTWHDAQSSCRALGAELVSILSMTEQSWLEATSDVWIGLNDLFYAGLFSWSDQHITTFTYWAPGEPNNHDGFSEDCVEMLHQSGRWNDVTCTELNTYICTCRFSTEGSSHEFASLKDRAIFI